MYFENCTITFSSDILRTFQAKCNERSYFSMSTFTRACTTINRRWFKISFPIGFLFDVTGTYDLAFYTAGAAIASAGIICLPLRFIQRCDGGATQRSIEQVEKSIAVRAEQNGEPTLKAAPQQKALISEHRLYSSATLLAGSHISIGLPNPYISYDKESSNSSASQVGASMEELRARSAKHKQHLLKNVLCDQKLSRSEPVINKADVQQTERLLPRWWCWYEE